MDFQFLIPIGICVVLPVMIVWLVMRSRQHDMDKKTEVMLKAIEAEGKKALIVMPEVDNCVIKSAANIPGVKTALVNTINVYDILNYDKFIVVKDAVAKIEEVYA